MSLLDFLFGQSAVKNESAAIAKSRLQIIVAHQRGCQQSSTNLQDDEWLIHMKEEILAVVSRYVAVDKDQVRIEMGKDRSLLELNILMPGHKEKNPGKTDRNKN